MLYSVLNKRKKVRLHDSEEYRFYLKNAPSFSSILSYYRFSLNETNPFRIIQANIILKAMRNKELIESKLKTYAEEANASDSESRDESIKKKIWALLDENTAPYFPMEKSRIYIPVFSRSLNLIYNEECSKILEYPYNELIEKPKTSCVDLFDTYSLDLYGSPFTSLILIRKDKSSSAFYHCDFETIYIINDQGRLDMEIPLFDRYIAQTDQHQIIQRIEKVVEKFYENDELEFVKALHDNGFISKKTYLYLRHKMAKDYLKKDRISKQGKDSDEVL